MGGKLSTGHWVFAVIGFLVTLAALRDLIPPGTLGMPNIVLAGIKGGIGAGLGLLAWEAIERMRGGGGNGKGKT